MNAKQIQLATDIAASRSLTLAEAHERLLQVTRSAAEALSRWPATQRRRRNPFTSRRVA